MLYPILKLTILYQLFYASAVQGGPVVGVQPDHARRQSTASKKAGIGWPNGEKADISQYYSDRVGWYYTWSAWPVPNTNLEFVPMFRRLESVPEFTSQVNPGTMDLNGIRHILGLNEPQEPSQGLIEPQAGADAWKSVLEPLKQANPSLRLGAPAVSNGPSGKIWLQQWFAACNGGCSVDFVPVHWYGLNASDFIAHVYDFHYTFQRPIWVTEWASHNFGDPALGQFSQEQVNEFLRNTQAFLDSTDFVERYAWFGAMLDIGNVSPANRLMSPEGTITDLGRQYISAQPPVQTTTQPITTTAATSTPLSSVVTTSPVTSTPTSSTVTSTATTRNGTIVIQTNQAFHTLIPFWTILVVSAVLALNSHVIPFI